MVETETMERGVDLQSFCSTEETRYYLKAPWSRGDHSYATNGHILVRVPRRADIPENDKAPDAGRLFDKYQATEYIDAPTFECSVAETGLRCDACDGTGHYHPCENCECGDCEACEGSGEHNPDAKCAVKVHGHYLARRYVRVMWALPGLKIAAAYSDPELPLNFRFDGGGEGQVMGLRYVPAEGWTVEVAGKR